MARSPKTTEPKKATLSSDELRRGIHRLTKRREQLQAFDPVTLDPQDSYSTVRPLQAGIETALEETFGHGTVEYNRYRSASQLSGWSIYLNRETPFGEKVQSVIEDKKRGLQLLDAAIELLNESLSEQSSTPEASPVVSAGALSNDIFIVHGHDDGMKDTVARLISRLGLRPVILHEQPNLGRTIIQKFREIAAEVGFAVVLLSPDDELKDGSRRARQNVILELGFFLGQLGPANVAALIKGDVQTPSDFDGVVYTKLDEAGHWQFALVRELNSAGYKVDANKLL